MRINNNKGAMTIVLLVMLSGMFIVMMGVAGVKMLSAAKNLKQHNEAYNYLIAMEDLGQAVSRARSLGKQTECIAHTVTPTTTNPTAAMYQAACPGTTRHLWVAAAVPKTFCPGHPRAALQTQNRYALCVPDINTNSIVDAVEFCATIDGFNYCLSGGAFNVNLERLDLNDDSPVNDLLKPLTYVEVGGAGFQQTGGALQPRNNSEIWSPNAAWANINEIFTTNCQGYVAANNPRYWLGCHFCNDPRVECWMMRMCPRSRTVPGAGACAGGVAPAQQRIVLYFENDHRDP